MEEFYEVISKLPGDRLESTVVEYTCEVLEQIEFERSTANTLEIGLSLLVHIAICSRENPEPTRKKVELLYSSFVVNSAATISEFHQLGEAITILTHSTTRYGADSLLGCQLTLPFSSNCLPDTSYGEVSVDLSTGCSNKSSSSSSSRNHVNNSIPSSNKNSKGNFAKKVVLKVSTSSHLFALQRFWCNIMLNLQSMKYDIPISFYPQRHVEALQVMFSSLHNLDTNPSAVTSICSAFHTIIDLDSFSIHSCSISIEMRVRIAMEILSWMSGILKKLSKGSNRYDLPSLSESEVVLDYLIVGDVIENLLISLVNNDKTSSVKVGLEVIQLLQIFVVNNYELLILYGKRIGDFSYTILLLPRVSWKMMLIPLRFVIINLISFHT
jgi:hypothetical protein